jgi:serine/threonine protein phosphatase PrpC
MSPEEQADVDLKDLVHKSNHIAADAHLGSATCTVVRLKDAITLETINVGDSGYSIHRRTKPDASGLEVVYASIPGQKGFNFPYQLGGRYGDQVDEPNVTDGPNTHKLQDKDVIVVVSDGIIDNIDPEEYHSCIQRYQWSDDIDWPTRADLDASHPNYFADSELVSHSAVADCIARKAYFLGKDKTYFSPFARSAATYGKRYLGGKHDDITVVVAQVSSTTTAAAPAKLDPHRAESIFLYKDSDGPIRSPKALPTMDEILRGILESVGGDPVAAEL